MSNAVKQTNPVTVTVCVTCRRDDAAQGTLSGEEMLTALGQAFGETPGMPQVSLVRQRCLMACKRSCVVAVRAHGKMAYVIGDFAPTEADAQAVADYVALYDQAEDGVVAYAHWPQGIKGHFIARLPPPTVPAEDEGGDEGGDAEGAGA